jgi:TonB family protein
MKDFLLYIGRSGLYLGLFYSFFLLVMRRTTHFRLNRTALLAGSFLCLAFPLIRLRTERALVEMGTLTMVSASQAPATEPAASAFPWTALLMGLYIAGAVVVLLLTLLSSGKMLRLIRSGREEWREGCRLVVTEEDLPSFSWGRRIVIGRKDLEQHPAILTHEQMHVKCRHSADLLLFFIFQLLFWWNPLVWITRTELKLLHEYEADEGVLQKGIDATQYQLLLVRKSVGEERFSLASGFQHANLKNRITMMLKPSSSAWMRYSYLALVPVLAAFMFACNPARSNNQEPDSAATESANPDGMAISVSVDPAVQSQEPAAEAEEIPFQLIDVKPQFNGGDANEFAKWVNSQLVYPESAKSAGIEGRVTLSFVIDTDGSVKDVKVLRGADPALDAEALRVISSCTEKWTPGMQDGKPVKVSFIFPVRFQLR